MVVTRQQCKTLREMEQSLDMQLVRDEIASYDCSHVPLDMLKVFAGKYEAAGWQFQIESTPRNETIIKIHNLPQVHVEGERSR